MLESATIAAIAASLAWLVPVYVWVLGWSWSAAWIRATAVWALYWVVGASAVAGFGALALGGESAGVVGAVLGGAGGAGYLGSCMRSVRHVRLLCGQIVAAIGGSRLKEEWPSIGPKLAALAQDSWASADVAYAMLLLLSARHVEPAQELLDRVRTGPVSRSTRAAVCYAATLIALARGDAAAARAAFADCPRPCPDAEWEDALGAADALVMIGEGDADRALSLVPPRPGRSTEGLWSAVQIHALAATGNEEGARLALLRVADGSPDELHVYAQSSLPGAGVARRLLTAKGSYR
jgi:hypothetical protein